MRSKRTLLVLMGFGAIALPVFAGCGPTMAQLRLMQRDSASAASRSSAKPDALAQDPAFLNADQVHASIVGLWDIKFLAGGQVVDEGFDVWHSDGTETLNDTPPPATGNVCLGVWAQLGQNTFKLRHPSWVFDEATNTQVGAGYHSRGSDSKSRWKLLFRRLYGGYHRYVRQLAGPFGWPGASDQDQARLSLEGLSLEQERGWRGNSRDARDRATGALGTGDSVGKAPPSCLRWRDIFYPKGIAMPRLWPGVGNQAVSEKEQRWRGHLGDIARGDSQALARLYDECAATLLGLACGMLKNDADAEEIILDVFEQVWRTASSFDPARGTVWRWLTLLVRSRAVDRLRSAASRHNRDCLPIAGDWDLVSRDPLPDRATIFSQERTLIKRALRNLPDEQRQPVELAYFSGLTHVEIAASLSLPLGTVKTRIRAGMDKLRAFVLQGGLGTAEPSK